MNKLHDPKNLLSGRFLIDMKDLLNRTAHLITSGIPQGDIQASGLGFSGYPDSNCDFISDRNWLLILDDPGHCSK